MDSDEKKDTLMDSLRTGKYEYLGGGFIKRKEIDQVHCPICGREFDIMEIAVHMDARGPSYSYCACSHCKKAWEVGQFKRGSSKIERREVRYYE